MKPKQSALSPFQALLRAFCVFAIVVCALAIAGSFPAVGSYRSRAVMAQRIRVTKESQLFGDAGETIGSPHMMIIDDSRAFLPKKEGSPALVDQDYLDKNGIYPLQLQTVEEMARLIRIALTVILVCCGLALLWIRKRVSRQVALDTASGKLP